MIHTKTINIQSQGFCDIINITPQVQEFVDEVLVSRESDERAGLVNIFVKGSTASITTIEYESNLVKDFQEFLNELIPENKSSRHGETWGDDNGFSHLRASLLGPSLSIPILNKQLQLGTWQQVVVCDFDNRPRDREVVIQTFI